MVFCFLKGITFYANCIYIYSQLNKLKVREKWVRTDIAHVNHFGNNSTNRVEGAHAILKNSIQSSSGSLYSVFEQIDEYYRSKVCRNY